MAIQLLTFRDHQPPVTHPTSQLSPQFLAPRYWPIWLGLGTMRLMMVLPFRWQLRLGGWIGRAFGRLATRRRRIAETNLALCFPELTDAQRTIWLQEHFTSLGIGLFEVAMAWWQTDEKLRSLAQVKGAEHLQQAMARGKGVILLTGHFTTLELGARLITLQQPFHAMYRKHKNPLYENAQRRQREWRCRLPPLPHEDLRGLLRAFKQGHAVWYAPDQDHGLRNSVFAAFFGVPACTLAATSRLATLSGAAVVPYFPRRLPGVAGYEIVILPALENFPGDDPIADARRINELLEHHIRQMPEQYLWVHRRFKTRPPGEPGFY
ncbi:MAG TPA: lipid A biosynthesis lauroyl acyltransferase [Gammaproteobacteria bacterium]|nr:lipid A biosynthesis lauroyl acyltransferase [Gammaproteobacteria bacterium]